MKCQIFKLLLLNIKKDINFSMNKQKKVSKRYFYKLTEQRKTLKFIQIQDKF